MLFFFVILKKFNMKLINKNFETKIFLNKKKYSIHKLSNIKIR